SGSTVSLAAQRWLSLSHPPAINYTSDSRRNRKCFRWGWVNSFPPFMGQFITADHTQTPCTSGSTLSVPAISSEAIPASLNPLQLRGISNALLPSCQCRFQTGSPAILVQIGSVNLAFQLAFPHFRCCRDVVG